MKITRLLLTFCFTILFFSLITSCKPMCPISSCQVRMVHPHGESEFRGQPFWKKQNPKMGEKVPKIEGEPTKKRHSKSKNKTK
ncbi:hypothetical protein [Botryobacter ruber]|uniref:hypothetical protein n=1 Tax=Botryobacter ruber TaxID=2171629 RepID=UPI000F646A9B|nr:hypothetical protein [Botryobacter ruber]